MTNKAMLWATVGCFVASIIAFELWKDYFIIGPAVHPLIVLFVISFLLFEAFSLVLGCRFIFKATRMWVPRAILLFWLLVGEVYAYIVATLGASFVGQ